MHQLPYEILLKIFKYLTCSTYGNLNQITSLQSVCKYWKEVASDAKLWHHVNFSLSFQLASKQASSNKQIEAAKFEVCLTEFMGN